MKRPSLPPLDWKTDPWYESHVELMVTLKSFCCISYKVLKGRREEHWKDREHASASMGTEL